MNKKNKTLSPLMRGYLKQLELKAIEAQRNDYVAVKTLKAIKASK